MKNLGLLAVASFVLAGCGMDYMSDPANSKVRFSAQLAGDSPGRASLAAAYSPMTQILQWQLSYGGLSGPITWAYLVGPDATGARAEIVPINMGDEHNPHPGSATLTAQQAQGLLAGQWSVVLKTAQHPAGELAGKIVRTQR
jgi:hypothetical protein